TTFSRDWSSDVCSSDLPGIGIQLEVPNHWSTHTLPSGHTYFTAQDNERLMLEVRPNCMQGLNTDTPTFINNTLLLFKAPESAVEIGRAPSSETVQPSRG